MVDYQISKNKSCIFKVKESAALLKTTIEDDGLTSKSKQVLNLDEVDFGSKEGSKEKGLVVGNFKNAYFTL